jgi:hypothetical protein
MKPWIFALCAAIAITVAGWTLYYFGLSPWTLFATAIILACPVGVAYYALWQSRQTRLDIEEGLRSSRNTPS